ncbi:hypothetical protein LB503_011768 [Fusarium chuoi]|nr:hypothetical protein LB503_011768 [Fusarium chuoi]
MHIMLVGQIPSSIIIHKIRPRIWMSSMVVVWAGLTMTSAACKTYAQLCAVRFLMGLAEASTYAGSIYIMVNPTKSPNAPPCSQSQVKSAKCSPEL